VKVVKSAKIIILGENPKKSVYKLG